MQALPNSEMATGVIALLVVLTLLSRLVLPAAWLPVTVHNGVWIITLACFGTGWIAYREASAPAWATLVLGLVAFNVGAWLGGRRAGSRAGPYLDPSPRALLGPGGLLILAAAYLIGYAGYVLAVSTRYGLGTLIADPESIRANADVTYLEAVPLPARLLLHLGPLLFTVIAVPHAAAVRLHWPIRALILIALALSMLTLLQRTNLFVAVLLTTALWLTRLDLEPHVRTPDELRRRRRFFYLGSLSIAGMIGAFQLIARALGGAAASARPSTIAQELFETPFVSLFAYLTGGTPAFLRLTESTNTAWPPVDPTRVIYGDYNPQTWGAALFENVVGLMPDVRAWDPIAPFVDVGTVTNVYTWLEPWYRDFREPGVVIGTLLLGVATGATYSNRYASPRAFWTCSLLLVVVAFAPFVQKIHDTMFIVILLTIIFGSSRPPRGAPVDVERAPVRSTLRAP